MDRYKVKITYVTDALGAVALNKDTYANHAGGANAPTLETLNDELEMVQESEERGITGFLRDDKGNIIEKAYILKGFAKAACEAMRRVTDSKSGKLKAYRKVIDQLFMVYPDNLVIHVPEGIDVNNLEILSRPLRASTAQGDRVALAHSEILPAGSWFECEILILGQIDEKLLREWLDYGQFVGLRQWRNSGYGRFSYELEKLS